MSKLTDEQIKDCLDAADQMYCPRDGDKEIFKARAIESAACEERDKRIAELEREIEAVRKDAERYRWLVSQMMHPDPDHQEEMFNRLHAINPDPANAKEVDAAIDAAMQKGQS